jgi:hypothetical protein
LTARTYPAGEPGVGVDRTSARRHALKGGPDGLRLLFGR